MMRHMMRHVVAAGSAAAIITMLMPQADASPESTWSEWSAPINLGAGINTSFSEAAPAISRDGLALYFVSNRPGVPPDAFGDNDIYVARRDSVDLPWGVPVNLGAKINTAAFEGFPALSANEHHLFFFRMPGDIWVSSRKSVTDDLGNDGWQSPVLLGPGVNTPDSEGGPAYFENRELGLPQLLFNSLRPGSALNDIYVADAFGAAVPVNALNSTGTDADPSMTADGREIFFHSNRPGSAGTDVYRSVRTSVLEPWSTPEPLGPVVNTAASENLVAIAPDGETLYFTSSREGGFGSNDIYVTTRTRDGIRLTLRTTDVNGTALGGSFVVIEPLPGVHPSPAIVELRRSQPLRVEAPVAVGACRFVRFVNAASGAVLISRVLNGSLGASEEWLAQYRCPR